MRRRLQASAGVGVRRKEQVGHTPRDMRRAKACFMASTKRCVPRVPAAGILRWYPAPRDPVPLHVQLSGQGLAGSQKIRPNMFRRSGQLIAKIEQLSLLMTETYVTTGKLVDSCHCQQAGRGYKEALSGRGGAAGGQLQNDGRRWGAAGVGGGRRCGVAGTESGGTRRGSEGRVEIRAATG